MSIGEVSSINNSSYVGQGSSGITAPVVESPAKSSQQAVQETIVKAVEKKEAEKNNEKDNASSGLTPSLKDAVSKINAASQSYEAVFGIHEETNRVTIKMVDKNTKEIVKEFPAEETLDLIAKAWELAGIMVDEKR